MIVDYHGAYLVDHDAALASYFFQALITPNRSLMLT